MILNVQLNQNIQFHKGFNKISFAAVYLKYIFNWLIVNIYYYFKKAVSE